jgi:hypothetical protein
MVIATLIKKNMINKEMSILKSGIACDTVRAEDVKMM